MQNSMELPYCFVGTKQLKIELHCDPSISLLGIYPEELKMGSQRDISTPTFIVAFFTIAKRCEQPQCPIDKWIEKMWYTYAMKYYLTFKKGNPSFAATWMRLEDIMLSEIN